MNSSLRSNETPGAKSNGSRKVPRRSRASSSRFGLLGLALAVIALALSPACHLGSASPSELDEARRLAADLRVQFNKAADASNRAVMADTDTTSIEYARDAEQTKRRVDGDATALTPLLQSLGLVNELGLLDQFQKRLAEYQSIDHDVLALAVENTNLKAQQLSFGPARDAANKFRDALNTLASAAAAKDACRTQALVDKAVVAVRETQVLQAPHIAELDDAAMTRMEQEMASLDARAKDALAELAKLDAANLRAPLATAQTALADFERVSTQIIALSRRNTNVRSLDLSLRAKPRVTSACDDSLRALEEALAKEGFKGTR